MIYAQIKNSTPTGIHKKFNAKPSSDEWLPIKYGTRVSSYDSYRQKIIPQRTIIEDGTKVLYEELIQDLPFEEVRTKKLNSLKKDRDMILENGFEFNGKNFQTRNERDISNLLGVGLGAVMALIASQSFSTNFIATDNSVISMDAHTTMQFIQKMLLEAQSVWDRYNIARDHIENFIEGTHTVNDILSIEM